ncbi:hypothetical protein HO913_11540, partial [Streptococcus suis]|nr:hypothetical protein [Streptococcus suis]
MGNRRMMSKTITHSQRFLKLPIEAQALYFHMLQNTDDDGITEVFPILKLLSVDETLLTCLVEARLIKQLNNELVYHILDFKEQNRIDKKRYKNILRLVVKKSPTGESTHYFFHSQDDKVEVS